MGNSQSTFVTVVAWIFIILSGFASLIFLLEGILFAALGNKGFLDKMPANAGPIDAVIMHVMVYVLLALFLLSAFMLATSVGLLLRKNWARLSFVGLLGVSIFWMLMNIGMQILMIVATSSVPPHSPAGPEFNRIFEVFTVILAVIGAGIIVLFVWIIRRLTTDPIRQEFLPQDALEM